MKFGNVTLRLHEQREKLTPSIEFRRRYLEASYASQIRVEKEMIQSHINKLPYGARKVFLASRLQKLNARLDK
jgi:hypothetical protein